VCTESLLSLSRYLRRAIKLGKYWEVKGGPACASHKTTLITAIAACELDYGGVAPQPLF
jgi:hypothetical protein